MDIVAVQRKTAKVVDGNREVDDQHAKSKQACFVVHADLGRLPLLLFEGNRQSNPIRQMNSPSPGPLMPPCMRSHVLLLDV